MRSLQTSPAWSVTALILAIAFIFWGISLLLNVNNYREKIKKNIQIIEGLTTLETSVRKLEGHFLGEQKNNIPIENYKQWQTDFSTFRGLYYTLTNLSSGKTNEMRIAIKHINKEITFVDSTYAKSYFFSEPSQPNRLIKVKVHQVANATVDILKTLISTHRQKLNQLSTKLSAEWDALAFLVFVSGILVICVSLLLFAYQKSFRKHFRTEQALHRITAEFRSIFRSISDAVVFTDTNYEIIMVNPAFTDLFGYRPEEAIGKKANFLFQSPTETQWENDDNYRLNHPPQEIQYQRKNKGVFMSETLNSVVLDVDKNVFGYFCIIRDISKRKRAESLLAEAHDKLEIWVQERTQDLMHANEEMKRFAYIVSHDLRAPLVNIKGFTGELKNAIFALNENMPSALENLPEKVQTHWQDLFNEDIPEALQFIDSSASRMGNLIDAMLKLSRLGRRELHFEQIDLGVMVKDVLESLAHQIEKAQAKITINPLPIVTADRTALEQMLSNIFVNAIKYANSEKPIEICISGKQRAEEAEICIQDNGRGISEADMPKVFEPFSRAGLQNIPGEGMGLAYVRTLVWRHNGNIWCKSSLEKGTSFSFTLSRQQLKAVV